MKNIVLNLVEYLYYFSLITLLILYLFPGSLIGYFLYGDLGKQPNLIENPIGTSINHLLCFTYLATLAVICKVKQLRIYNSFYFLCFISVFLEITHLIIPNRAFEFYDLVANLVGVLIIFILKRLII